MVIAGRYVSHLGAITVTSIGINLFFVGMILSSYAAMPAHPASEPRFERIVEEVARNLPTEDASFLRRTFALHRPELTEKAERAAALEDRARAAIRQDPVDPILIRTTLTAAQSSQHALVVLMFDTVADASIGMSLKGREALADWRRHRP